MYVWRVRAFNIKFRKYSTFLFLQRATINQTSGNQFIVWKKLEQGCLCQRKARKDLHNLLLFCNMYTMFTVYPECPPPPLANPFISPCALFLFPLNVRTIQMQMTNIVYCAARPKRCVSSSHRILSFQFRRIMIIKTDS